MTITTLTLANELKITQKTVRMAIKAGYLRATRIKKGRGESASATHYVIRREDADDWIRRRAAKKIGEVYPLIGERPSRRPEHHAYFPNEDDDDYSVRVSRWLAAALTGCEQAKRSLRTMEQPLVRWERAGVGKII